MVFVSYEGLTTAPGGDDGVVDKFVKGRRKDPFAVKEEVEGFVRSSRRGWPIYLSIY